MPCSLDLVVWLGAQGIIPQSLSAVPSPSFSHSAAETLPVSHVSRDTLMCMVLSECEIEVRDQRLEERLYLRAGVAAHACAQRRAQPQCSQPLQHVPQA